MAEAEPTSDLPLALSRPVPAGVRLEDAFVELSDGYRTHAHVYTPVPTAAQPGPAREPIVYLHGIQSHPGWFSGSAARLAAAGHPVLMPTRRGSGANTVARGDAASAELLLEDLAACCRAAMERFDATRVRLVGVSWGGKLAAVFCTRQWAGIDVASLTMVAPGIAAKVDVPLRQKLAIGMALLGRGGADTTRGGAMFDIPLNDPAMFTDNPAMRAYLEADRHRLHQASARFLYASNKLDSMLRTRSGAIAAAVTLMLASRDRIINNDATRKLVGRLTGDKARVMEFDAAHTIEFEEDPAGFFDALVAAVE